MPLPPCPPVPPPACTQVSVVDELGVPVKFVGVGEGIEDLQPFDPAGFVEALFPEGGAGGEGSEGTEA